GRFRLDEDGVVAALEDLDHPHHIGFDEVLQRRGEALVVILLIGLTAVFGREDRADEHLVDRGEQLDPWIALGELAGISREQLRKVGVLEVADPVGHSEVSEVDDWRDLAPLQLREGEVGKFPVELARAEVGLVDRRGGAEIVDPDLGHAVEILAPALVMAANRHLVDAGLAMVDRRDAVLDPGREHEVGDASVSSGVCFVGPARAGCGASIAAPGEKRKPCGAKSRSRGFPLMSGKSMRWADGFIAVDWGTNNQRASLIDSGRKRAGEFEDGKGILSVPEGGFPAAIAEIREKLGDMPLLLAVMVGSNRGWKDAPYVPCPAGIDDLARKLVWAGEREAIVPGVSYVGDDRADVMRGEEVQLVGAVGADLVGPDALVCHPGTHNKWTVLHQEKIQSFRTVMTGELFSLLKEHSILADLLQGPVDDNDVFRTAAKHAIFNEALPAELFSIRASLLLGQRKK